MSDITLEFAWWELLIVALVMGWPGAIPGGFLGARWWRTRPILGGVLGALIGDACVCGLRILMA